MSICLSIYLSVHLSLQSMYLSNQSINLPIFVNADGLVPISYCDFIYPMSRKYCTGHEKSGQVIRSAAPVTQNRLSKPEDLLLKNAASLRKSAPWPPNMSGGDVFFVLRLPCEMHVCGSFSNVPRLPLFSSICVKVENPWRAPPNMPLQHPKVVREAHLEVKALKAHHVWNNFGSVDVEKVHVVLVRSTFGSI